MARPNSARTAKASVDTATSRVDGVLRSGAVDSPREGQVIAGARGRIEGGLRGADRYDRARSRIIGALRNTTATVAVAGAVAACSPGEEPPNTDPVDAGTQTPVHADATIPPLPDHVTLPPDAGDAGTTQPDATTPPDGGDGPDTGDGPDAGPMIPPRTPEIHPVLPAGAEMTIDAQGNIHITSPTGPIHLQVTQIDPATSFLETSSGGGDFQKHECDISSGNVTLDLPLPTDRFILRPVRERRGVTGEMERVEGDPTAAVSTEAMAEVPVIENFDIDTSGTSEFLLADVSYPLSFDVTNATRWEITFPVETDPPGNPRGSVSPSSGQINGGNTVNTIFTTGNVANVQSTMRVTVFDRRNNPRHYRAVFTTDTGLAYMDELVPE